MPACFGIELHGTGGSRVLDAILDRSHGRKEGIRELVITAKGIGGMYCGKCGMGRHAATMRCDEDDTNSVIGLARGRTTACTGAAIRSWKMVGVIGAAR